MSSNSIHTDLTINEYFLLEQVVFSTAFADAYKALDRSRQANITLLVSRFSVGLDTPSANEYIERMERIDSFSPPLVQVTAYSVDSAGFAFAVLPPLEGTSITSGRPDFAEAERRLTGAIHKVSALHAEGMTEGGISGNSFWIDRNGQVRWASVIGALRPAALGDFTPPSEIVPYLAPEFKPAAPTSPAADVFALGVLTYFIFSGEYPHGPAGLAGGRQAEMVPLSSIRPQAPGWTGEVLARCLDPNPTLRYQSATELLQAIQDARSGVSSAAAAPLKVETGVAPVSRPGDGIVTQGMSISEATAKHDAEPAAKESERPGLPLIVKALAAFGIAAAVCVGAAVYFMNLGEGRGTNLRETLSIHRDAVVDPHLRDAIDVISEQDLSLRQKAEQLAQIAGSDDPLAHDVLAKTAAEAQRVELRQVAEQYLLDRIERVGYQRGATLLKEWLRAEGRAANATNYQAVLRMFDSAMPPEERARLYRQVYAEHPEFVLKVAASIVLDTDKWDDYRGVLAQLIGDSLNLNDASSRSSAALMLMSPVVALPYGEDLLAQRARFPDSDIFWLVEGLAERGDVSVRLLADAALQRKLVPPPRDKFLQIVRDRSDLVPELLLALIRGSLGQLTATDVGSFGRWFDSQSEEVLLLICADKYDPEIREVTFDVLSGKSLTEEPAASLVDWVRREHWDRRAEFVPLIGALANLESIDQQHVEQAMAAVDTVARTPDIIELLLKTKEPKVMRLLVEKYPDVLGLGVLLQLLDDRDNAVKLATIKALTRFNDVGALKLIIDHYEAETDVEIRQAYKENFWFIKKREGN